MSFACSIVGLDDDPTRPPPIELRRDGLRFIVSSSVHLEEFFGDTITDFEVFLVVKNVSDSEISRQLRTDHSIMRLYQEGEWGEPVFDALEDSHGTTTDGYFSLRLAPGETTLLNRRWLHSPTVPEIEESINAALEPDLYRAGVLLRLFEDEPEIIASEPLELTQEHLRDP